MTREWKPGDVAMADGPNCVSFIVVRTGYVDSSYWSAPGEWPSGVSDDECEFRPLVVIDAEDREQVERLVKVLSTGQPLIGLDPMNRKVVDEAWVSHTQAALREFANPTPPKPDEPMGLGAVVEDAEGHTFVRVAEAFDGWAKDRDWQRIGGELNAVRNFGWSDIAAVRILSEGVRP